jgi:predicted AAA+ superfamily ATPase
MKNAGASGIFTVDSPEPPAVGVSIYINRILSLNHAMSERSCFLWGPRQTGKTSLLRETLPNAKHINLLHHDVFMRYSRQPEFLRQELAGWKHEVVIDEIQRVPELLNEIHAAIEDYGLKFVITGSSPRKLRRSGVNLLGGRARTRFLHPFVWGGWMSFSLEKVFLHGHIPSIFLSSSPNEDLTSYCGDYLREEIIAEGLSRSVPAFNRFLRVAALCSGIFPNTERHVACLRSGTLEARKIAQSSGKS